MLSGKRMRQQNLMVAFDYGRRLLTEWLTEWMNDWRKWVREIQFILLLLLLPTPRTNECSLKNFIAWETQDLTWSMHFWSWSKHVYPASMFNVLVIRISGMCVRSEEWGGWMDFISWKPRENQRRPCSFCLIMSDRRDLLLHEYFLMTPN